MRRCFASNSHKLVQTGRSANNVEREFGLYATTVAIGS